MSYLSIDWNDVIIKKQEVVTMRTQAKQKKQMRIIFLSRGIISKDKFYITIDMVESFDGNVLSFNISEGYATAMFLKLD